MLVKQSLLLTHLFIVTVLLANAVLLLWIGADLKTLIGSWLIQTIWMLGGSVLIANYRTILRDPVIFYLCAYAAGLMLFFFIGFIVMHRGVLGDMPRIAAIVSLTPLVILALISRFVDKTKRPKMSHIQWNSVSILLFVSFVIAAMGTYGFDNNDQWINIDDSEWIFQRDITPNWASQSDRSAHYNRILVPTFENGFPPTKVNHRAFHVTTLFVCLLTGEMNRPHFMATYKTLSLTFFFMLAYGLYAIGKDIFGLQDRLATFVASSALVFSPLKLPLFELSPTYRGFITASGSLYHSDTHYTSLACSAAAVYLILISLKTRQQSFFLGCLLVAGAFFLKPVNFIILAPASYVIAILCWKDFNRDRLLGLAILLAIPILWFSYIYMSGVNSNIDDVLQRTTLDSTKNTSLSIQPKLFAGYLPKLQDRFPAWINQSSILTALSMIGLSFAAFWVAGFTALQQSWKQINQGQRLNNVVSFAHQHAHIYFVLGFFVLALFYATILSDHQTKNEDWKWSIASAYVLCIPLFAKAITQIKQSYLRIASWILYGLQTGQGIGYLWYLFWYSKLF